MGVEPQANLLAEWADVLPPQFYGKLELRRAYFDFLASMLVSRCHPETVLDIGCGTGDLVIAFQRLSVNAMGLDINKRALLFASRLGSGFQCADIEKSWPIKDNTVDILTALEVLEHLHNPSHFIAEARRILRPGGFVFITTPSPIPMVSPALHFILQRDKCEEHISEHNKLWWTQQFRRGGFSHCQDLTPDIKKWRMKHGFYWELPWPERLFLHLGYLGRYLANELHSLFSCALLFQKPATNEVRLIGQDSNNNIRKICLLGISSSRNLGDRALELETIRLLKKAFPAGHISCQSYYRAVDIQRYLELFQPYLAEGCKILPALLPTTRLTPKDEALSYTRGLYYIMRSLFLLLFFRVTNAKGACLLWHKLDRRAWQDLISADLVVHKGADYFANVRTGLRGLANAFIAFYPLIVAAMFGRPIVILGASMGPFSGRLAQALTKTVLSRVSKIFVRESYSREFLMTAGVNPTTISIIPDLAFARQQGHPIMEPLPTTVDHNNKVGISITSPLPGAKKWIVNPERYLQVMARLSDYIAETMSARIILIPHTIDVPNDDTVGLREVWKLMKHQEQAEILRYNPSPDYLRAIYQQMDLVVTSRVHGVVISRPTPVVAIPVVLKHRVRGIMESLNLKEYCVPSEPLDLQELKEVVEKAWANRAAIKAQQEVVMKSLLLQLDGISEELRALVGVIAKPSA